MDQTRFLVFFFSRSHHINVGAPKHLVFMQLLLCDYPLALTHNNVHRPKKPSLFLSHPPLMYTHICTHTHMQTFTFVKSISHFQQMWFHLEGERKKGRTSNGFLNPLVDRECSTAWPRVRPHSTNQLIMHVLQTLDFQDVSIWHLQNKFTESVLGVAICRNPDKATNSYFVLLA